jgi:hypothetical protein
VYLQEEEEGSEDDSNVKPDFTVTLKTDFSARCFLDQFEDDADGFISPMDDKMPSKSSQDTGLSNLHAASMYVMGGELKWFSENNFHKRHLSLLYLNWLTKHDLPGVCLSVKKTNFLKF